MEMSEELKLVDIDKLVPYARNSRTHSPEQIKQIQASIREFGFVNPVLIDGKFNIIAGHGRVLAAKAEGLEEVPCVLVEHLTETQKKAYILADNQLALNAGWDTEMLKIEIEELKELDFDIGLIGFDGDEIDLLFKQEEEIEEDDFDVDQALGEIVEPITKRGDVWQLGRHRLMCGDSTIIDDVEKLMDGNKAILCLQDPPYGINIVQVDSVGGEGLTHFGSIGGGKIVKTTKYSPVKGDETTDTARDNYSIISSISNNQIIFGGNYFTDFLPPRACWVIWDKENTGNFADVEIAWTSFNKGAKLYKWLWNGMSRKGDRKTEGKKRVHPTQKPVGLMGAILQDFSKENDIIVDTFGGSGSTLIACEQTSRTCYMSELDEKYVDVIIKRWETLTEQKAVLLDE